MTVTHRLDAIRDRLSVEGVDAIIVSVPTNVAYLTGFESVFDDEPAAVLVVGVEIAWLYTDSRYIQAARAAAAGGPWEVRLPDPNPYESVCDALLALEVGSVALEDSVPYGRFRYVSEKLGGNVVPSRQWVEEVRQFKDAEELRRIAAAAEVTDRAFEHILGFVTPGMTERAVALELEVFMRRECGAEIAFSPIVASGPNSALPHAKPSERAIGRGDLLKMDFGARVGGYCADMTRTVSVGPASDRQREIHATVLLANEAGIAAVTPGRSGRDVDAIARAVIEDAGFGDNFGHGLGHGVGLAVHELPNVNARGRTPLAPGHVVTVEPGIYVPDFGGVRIEDLVAVTAEGGTVLSASSKELLEL